MTDREETLVYRFDRDLQQVLHNIVSVWNRNKDFKQRWNINPKEEVFVNLKTQGNVLELRVEGRRGGWRVGAVDNREMNKYLAEMRKHLKSAESDLRKEFKQVTGKAFRWSNCKEWADFQPVALNNLFSFKACKAGPVSVEIDGQKHSEDGPEIDGGKIDKEGKWGITDIIKLPKRW